MSGALVGSSPNWVAGYVPPAAEWNAEFAKKLDVDDPILAGGPFMSLAGGTFTGEVKLPTIPVVDAQQAVPKSYVDSLTFAAGPFMPVSGGTFSGPVIHTATLTLAGNPTNNLDAAPKQYVDAVTTVANNALTVANAAVRRAGDTMTGALTLPFDPINLMHASTKQYTDTKLALAGGTVTGSLTVNQQLAATSIAVAGGPGVGVLYVNSFNGYEWNFTVDGNGNHYQSYRAGGWYDVWNSTNGTRSWVVGGGTTGMYLDGGGNVGVAGQITSNSIVTNTISSNGSIFTNGAFIGTSLGMGPWVFYNDGNQIQQHTTGWYDMWRTSDGYRFWIGGNVIQMSLDPSGSLGVRNGLSANAIATNVLTSNGQVGALGGAMYIGQSGTSRLMTFTNDGWYWEWDGNTGNLMWTAPFGQFWFFNATQRTCYNQLGPTGGNGNYFNISDERVKADVAPSDIGLLEILALRPIRFNRVYDGIKSDRVEIGFSAQQVMPIIPEAVRSIGMMLPDDEDEPALAMTDTPIIVALVNSVKQLAAEVAALKAAR